MGKILELSDDTYQHLVDLAQQQQRTPEEMLRVCLATYEAARYERVRQPSKRLLRNRCGCAMPSLSIHTVRGREV